jgi:hypothetical protein
VPFFRVGYTVASYTWGLFCLYIRPAYVGAKYLRYWKNHLSFDNGKIFADVA